MTQRISCGDGAHRDQAVASAMAAVRRGDLVVIPTETVYALAADAFSPKGMAAMRQAKGYDDATPLPVMVGRRVTVPGVAARLTDEARSLMEAFWPGPLTLLVTPQPSLAWSQPSDAPLAIRMPLHPLTLALLEATGPLVVTTASTPGLPAPLTADDALAQVGDDCALALDSGPLPGDGLSASTVIDATSTPPRILRHGALETARIREVCPAVVDGEEASTA